MRIEFLMVVMVGIAIWYGALSPAMEMIDEQEYQSHRLAMTMCEVHGLIYDPEDESDFPCYSEDNLTHNVMDYENPDLIFEGSNYGTE